MKGTTYKEAGVDIEKGDEFVQKIKKITQSKTIGLFGAVFDISALGMKAPLLISGTDGVGTKLKLAFRLQKHDTIGIDLVAMCVNDILCHGARPLFFLDYIGTSKLNLEIGSEIIKGIVKGCEEAKCDLVGGETAEMPGIYKEEEYDLAGFAVGAVEKDNLLPKKVEKNDDIIALPSSGVHSNGFSLINHIIENTNETSIELLLELLTPTKIYVAEVLNILSQVPEIRALCHITGGGLYENIARVVPPLLKPEIEYDLLPSNKIFKWIAEKGNINFSEMQRVFNLGVGFTIIAPPTVTPKLLSLCPNSRRIGKIS